MGKVLDELATLHEFVVAKEETNTRPKKLHLHFLERLPKPPSATAKTGMTLAEAIHALGGKEPTKPNNSVWLRVARLERLARSDDAIYALKTVLSLGLSISKLD
jgi:hypothetical protein